MSAIEFYKDKKWRFCANGCQSGSSKGGARGPLMTQTVVFVLGRPFGGDVEDSGFCPACVDEMRQAWDGALRERQEAERVWDATVGEIAA